MTTEKDFPRSVIAVSVNEKTDEKEDDARKSALAIDSTRGAAVACDNVATRTLA
jgi:hypothetical protein